MIDSKKQKIFASGGIDPHAEKRILKKFASLVLERYDTKEESK